MSPTTSKTAPDNLANFYLVLTILGIAVPYAALVPWVFDSGLAIALFIEQAMHNPISIFAWLDVVIAAICLLLFIIIDGAQHQIRYRYAAVVGTLTVGVSFGLPLYLYLKAKQHK
ncbi:DUF2834 domain-containing protein [Catenovulum sp. SM1970]|uniref:DUF2834 domain-containing protein n=1 Tax=Marinifaba aquimaris TaxID=2741323 RepID=UPI001574622F|nr:DUF2834 domain-containing protein [Marinifaba aquimaris]NTS76790.1 DUF2834 domain-containing protein [Marinifaba aquimaris]